ncbi:MAG: S41 family peptidase [Bacteroidota bacterium]|nr:S41 family peptidase [Bacteroidota bacterium]
MKINGYSADSIFIEFAKYHGAEREDFKFKMVSGIFDVYLWLHNINPPYEIICQSKSDQISSFKSEGRVLSFKSSEVIQPAPSFNNYSFEILPENIGYLNYRLMRNDKENPFSEFLKNTFSELKTKHAKGLIVDLRKNGGGNSDFGKELLKYITDKPFRTSAKKIWRSSTQYKKYMRKQIPWWAGWATYPPVIWIAGLFTDETGMFTASDGECIELIREEEIPGENPLRFNGRVCFLIGPGTFSAAVDLANAVGDYRLAELIGEETGGIPNSYGEVYNFVLPNTKIEGGISSAYFVRANGNEKNGHGVLPDIKVRQSAEDMARNYDTVLEAAKKWILK